MNIRMSTKGKRPLRSLTPSDKVHAIQRIHDGESKASVARDIGVPESTLRGWCKNEDKLRFMSRQSTAEKMGGGVLTDKLDGNLLSGPSEKRQRIETDMPLNFSNKIKFDELTSFKRAPITGMEFAGTKPLNDIAAFNGLAADYGGFNGAAKNNVFLADISRSADPSINAISPLSSLSHLPGLTGLSQSPLAMSFNDITSNLNLLAQLNPGLAAISGLSSLANTSNSLRGGSLKSKPQIQSPHSDNAERQTGITVKNWAKQKPAAPVVSCDGTTYGLSLSNSDTAKLKAQSVSLIPQHLGANYSPLPTLPEDSLLYWLKSQQAMLGLNNLYPPPPAMAASSPPIRSSTPQQQNFHTSSSPIIPTPLTPSSTPSGSLDDKNSAWFNWCKAFGASLNSLAPTAVVLHGNVLHQTVSSLNGIDPLTNPDSQDAVKTGFENILYSQLTKDSEPSPSSLSVERVNCGLSENVDLTNKPEDLSAKSIKKSAAITPLPTPAQSPDLRNEQNVSLPNSLETDCTIRIGSGTEMSESVPKIGGKNNMADCRNVLDNLLYKMNNNDCGNTSNNIRQLSSAISESEASYSSDHINLEELNHNNSNSNKTDEENFSKCFVLHEDDESEVSYKDAISNGEKFLQWLENCRNPRVTAVQVMQLRFLISLVKTLFETKANLKESTCTSKLPAAIEIDDSSEESNRSKARR